MPDVPHRPDQRDLPDRPYVLLSCGMSIDGYLDSPVLHRLLLSNEADFDRVDEERAASDAILVGAQTIRRDNPRLLVRSSERAARVAPGPASSPTKVTRLAARTSIRGRDSLPATMRRSSSTARRRRWPRPAPGSATRRRSSTPGSPAASTASARTSPPGVSAASWSRAEGRCTRSCSRRTSPTSSSSSSAPFFVGSSKATRFVGDGDFPWNPDHRATLAEVRQIGDVVLLRYALSSRFSMS